MRYRARLLVALAVVLVAAGCLGNSVGPVGTTTTDSPTATESPTRTHTVEPAATPTEPTTASTSTVTEPTSTSAKPTTTTGTTEKPTTPLASPEKPANLTTESVAEYARQHERRVTYEAVKQPDNRVNLTCAATVEDRTENGFYARAGCAVITRSDGGVGSGGPGIGRGYFINDTTTVPVKPARRADRARDTIYRSRMDAENVHRAPGLRILNFDTERHNVAVTLTYLGTTPSESAFENEYTVSVESGITQDGVTLRKGTYRLRVRIEDGTTTTYRWNVTEDTVLVSVHVTRSGEIAIRTPSVLRLPKP